jgi:hypothetical protein
MPVNNMLAIKENSNGIHNRNNKVFWVAARLIWDVRPNSSSLGNNLVNL